MPEMDGIQDSPVAKDMAIANLDFNDWAVIPPYTLE